MVADVTHRLALGPPCHRGSLLKSTTRQHQRLILVGALPREDLLTMAVPSLHCNLFLPQPYRCASPSSAVYIVKIHKLHEQENRHARKQQKHCYYWRNLC